MPDIENRLRSCLCSAQTGTALRLIRGMAWILFFARGLWFWILAIAGVSFLTLVGTTALAEIVGGFLGNLFEPQEILDTVWSAVRAALIAAVFTFLAQLAKGLMGFGALWLLAAAGFCEGTAVYAALTGAAQC